MSRNPDLLATHRTTTGKVLQPRTGPPGRPSTCRPRVRGALLLGLEHKAGQIDWFSLPELPSAGWLRFGAGRERGAGNAANARARNAGPNLQPAAGTP